MHKKIWPPGYTPEPMGGSVCVSSDIFVAVSGQGMEHSTHTPVVKAISGSHQRKGKGGQGGREMGKYIQNINARDLISRWMSLRTPQTQ